MGTSVAGRVGRASELLSRCRFTLDMLGWIVVFSPARRRAPAELAGYSTCPESLVCCCCLCIVTGLWGLSDNQYLELWGGCLQISLQISGPVVVLLTHEEVEERLAGSGEGHARADGPDSYS